MMNTKHTPGPWRATPAWEVASRTPVPSRPWHRPTLNAREPRTLRDVSRDAFDWLEVHRAPLLLRWWRAVSNVVFVVVVFGALGAMLAWGGRAM